MPLAAARSLLGAGGRALIARGFKLSGRELAPAKLHALFVDFLAHYNAHIADRDRRSSRASTRASTAVPTPVGGSPCAPTSWSGSSRLLLDKLGVARPLRLRLRPGHVRLGKPDPRPFVETVRAVGGELIRAVMVGISGPTSRPRAPPATPVIVVDFGYSDVPWPRSDRIG